MCARANPFAKGTAKALSGGGGRPRPCETNAHRPNQPPAPPTAQPFNRCPQAIQEYGADAMRWALADAGDTMDDANFETTTANAAILRLTKELAWIEECLAPGSGACLGGGCVLSGCFWWRRISGPVACVCGACSNKRGVLQHSRLPTP